MRGIINREEGPVLGEILKLLSRRERTCRLELVTRRGDLRGIITLDNGALCNATVNDLAGEDALVQLLSQDLLNFQSFPEVENERRDWPNGSSLEILLREAELRRREQRLRQAETARQFRRLSLIDNTLEGDLEPEERQPVKEEIGFLEFYGKEMSSLLDLGKLHSFGYTEETRSLVVGATGDAWTGGVRGGAVASAQMIEEARL